MRISKIARRRTYPGDNYISRLLASEIDGEPVADILILNMCILILVVGVDTTWSTISSSLLHFATHPKDRQRLTGQPELLSSAVEEMLRLHAPASAGRVAMADVEHDGLTFKRDRMLLSFPAANRDLAVFECAPMKPTSGVKRTASLPLASASTVAPVQTLRDWRWKSRFLFGSRAFPNSNSAIGKLLPGPPARFAAPARYRCVFKALPRGRRFQNLPRPGNRGHTTG